MEIDYYKIIPIIFSSSLIAAGLTFLGNKWLQRESYKKDYYKRLLDKRINAYESIENLANSLKGRIELEDGRLSPMITGFGQEHFSNFMISLMESLSRSVWLSNPIGNKVTEINAFLLNEIDHQINENSDYDSQLIELGIAHFEKFREFRKDLELMLYNDFRNLHDIEDFIKKAKPSELKIPIYQRLTSL